MWPLPPQRRQQLLTARLELHQPICGQQALADRLKDDALLALAHIFFGARNDQRMAMQQVRRRSFKFPTNLRDQIIGQVFRDHIL